MKIALLIALAAVAAPAQNRMAEDLRKGVVAEETGTDLNAAIQSYKAVVAQFDEERKAAANAVFQMAEQDRKRGRSDQAMAAYARVVEEFADQAELVKQSRARLPASYKPKPLPGALPANAQVEARTELRNQLKIQLDLARKDYDAQFLKFKLGYNQHIDLVNASAQVAKAERDFVGFDLWLAESAAGGSGRTQAGGRR